MPSIKWYRMTDPPAATASRRRRGGMAQPDGSKVCCVHQGAIGCGVVVEPPARRQRLLRVLVERHMPVRMLEMERMHRGVAQAEQPLPLGTDGDGQVARCVAGRGKDLYPRHDLVLAINQDDLIAHRLEAAAGDFTCHVLHHWPGRVRPGPVPFDPRHHVPGVRERRLPVDVGCAAHVIGMPVR